MCLACSVLVKLGYCALLVLFPLPATIDQTTVEAMETPVPQKKANLNSTTEAATELRRRAQTTSFVSTCGYKDGDINKPRTADLGYDCRVDTQHALWGFCPTTVIVASDCGLAGNCVDSHSCSRGCGIVGTPGITTFTCTVSEGDYCSTALLTAGPDQTYSYIACANAPITEHLLAAPLITPSALTDKSSSSSILTAPSTTSSSFPPMSASTTFSSQSVTQPATPSSPIYPSTSSIGPNVSNSTSSNIGAIVGGVIGGTALICFVILAVLFLQRHRRDHPTVTPAQAALEGNHGINKDLQAFYDIQRYVYECQKQSSPVELSTQKANSPFELLA